MPTAQRHRSRALEKQATALLRCKPDAARLRGLGLVSVSDKQADKGIGRRNRIAARLKTLQSFRDLPKERRRELSIRFKSERAADPTLSWNEWLPKNLR
jgi:hypothetical protein